MADNLTDMLLGLESDTTVRSKDAMVHRAPFGYIGGKSRSVNHILPHLPYEKIYVEPFGGSGVILLNRNPSPLEVLNDRYMGVVAFYRCIRDATMLDRLAERIDLTLHAREEWVWCADTWKNCDDDVERAARWFYMMQYSFASKGKAFGRSTQPLGMIAGKVRNKIKMFPFLHERLKCVQIENQDWENCMLDYDTHDTVFYIDPPYVDAHRGSYDYELSKNEHRNLIDIIFHVKGFCAVSGYPNPLYDEQPWDDRIEFKIFTSVKPMAFHESNSKAKFANQKTRGHLKEVLWIKEAK